MEVRRLRIGWARVCWLALGIVVAVVLTKATWRWGHPVPPLREIRYWADRGQWDRAQEAAAQVLATRPRDAEAILLAARIAAGLGDVERCVSLLEQVPENSEAKPEAIKRQAQAELHLNRGRRAEAAWRALIQYCANEPNRTGYLLEARAELVAILSLERRTAEMAATLWQMYPAHTERWRVLLGILRAHSRGSTPQAAIEALERFAEQDSDDFDARRALALASIDSLQWDRAIKLAGDCLIGQPGDERSREILLECFVRKQDREAVKELVSQMDVQSLSPRALRFYAQHQESMGETAGALASYRRALELEPVDATTHFQFAQLLQRAGQSDAASSHLAEFHRLKGHEDALAQFLTQFPQSSPESWAAPEPSACVETADHCASLGRRDEARAWLEEALRQHPEFPSAREAMKKL